MGENGETPNAGSDHDGSVDTPPPEARVLPAALGMLSIVRSAAVDGQLPLPLPLDSQPDERQISTPFHALGSPSSTVGDAVPSPGDDVSDAIDSRRRTVSEAPLLIWPAVVSVQLPISENVVFLRSAMTAVRRDILATNHPVQRSDPDGVTYFISVDAPSRDEAQRVAEDLGAQLADRLRGSDFQAGVDPDPILLPLDNDSGTPSTPQRRLRTVAAPSEGRGRDGAIGKRSGARSPLAPLHDRPSKPARPTDEHHR